jgi:hypothetical protein
VSDSGSFRLTPNAWQRGNVAAAAAYLREIAVADPANVRAKALYEGLLDVLDPTRRTTRQQRELARPTGAERVAERRGPDRRTGIERRQKDLRIPEILDRRKAERRAGRDRRKG